MACFADINVSQGSVATCARCSGIFNMHLTANLPRNLPVKNQFLNQLGIDRIMVMSLWPRFLAHPVRVSDRCQPLSEFHGLRSILSGTASSSISRSVEAVDLSGFARTAAALCW